MLHKVETYDTSGKESACQCRRCKRCPGSIPGLGRSPGEGNGSFFLELVLHWFPVAYWAPTNLGSLSFSVLSFCLFILFMGFSRQEYWNDLPFPPPVDRILSDLSPITRPSWVAPHDMAWFYWFRQAVVHVIRLASCLWLWFQSVCPLMPSLSTYHLTKGFFQGKSVKQSNCAEVEMS